MCFTVLVPFNEWVNGTSTQMAEAAKQFGVQYLAQGYFDLQGGLTWDSDHDPPIGG